MTEPDLAGCPECGAPAEVVDRFELTSTAGPVEHVELMCVRRHWFVQLAERCPATAKAETTTGTPARH
jgi:hypothetical protein